MRYPYYPYVSMSSVQRKKRIILKNLYLYLYPSILPDRIRLTDLKLSLPFYLSSFCVCFQL